VQAQLELREVPARQQCMVKELVYLTMRSSMSGGRSCSSALLHVVVRRLELAGFIDPALGIETLLCKGCNINHLAPWLPVPAHPSKGP
jgi:hypothetical protein